jgi:hypothetical protein
MNDNILDEPEVETEQENTVVAGNLKYPDPEAYRVATNKRFRMTKAQKERGIDRQAAFIEFMQGK